MNGQMCYCVFKLNVLVGKSIKKGPIHAELILLKQKVDDELPDPDSKFLHFQVK